MAMCQSGSSPLEMATLERITGRTIARDITIIITASISRVTSIVTTAVRKAVPKATTLASFALGLNMVATRRHRAHLVE